MKFKLFTLTAILLIVGGFLAKAQSKWTIDKNHSDIRFTAIHYVISEVDGEFKEFDGSVETESDGFEGAQISFTAQVASIDTDNERRDNHLKSDDFFNAEAYPTINFSGKLQKEGDQYYLVGDFTMRDVTKPIKFKVKHIGTVALSKGKKAGFKITGAVDRFDYGIKFDRVIETGGLAVSREIQITCNIELNESKGS